MTVQNRPSLESRSRSRRGPELAGKTYDVLLAPAGGFERTAALDLEGARTILKLRSEYGRPQKALGDPARYVDLSYYERASEPH